MARVIHTSGQQGDRGLLPNRSLSAQMEQGETDYVIDEREMKMFEKEKCERERKSLFRNMTLL